MIIYFEWNKKVFCRCESKLILKILICIEIALSHYKKILSKLMQLDYQSENNLNVVKRRCHLYITFPKKTMKIIWNNFREHVSKSVVKRYDFNACIVTCSLLLLLVYSYYGCKLFFNEFPFSPAIKIKKGKGVKNVFTYMQRT